MPIFIGFPIGTAVSTAGEISTMELDYICERSNLTASQANACGLARQAPTISIASPGREVCNASGSFCGTTMAAVYQVTPLAKPDTSQLAPAKPSRATGVSDRQDGGNAIRAARSNADQGAIDSGQRAAQATDSANTYSDAAALTRGWQGDVAKRTESLSGQLADLRSNGRFSAEDERKFLGERLSPDKFKSFYEDAGIVTKQDLVDQADKLQKNLKQGADTWEKNSEFWKNEARQANGATEKMQQFKRELADSELKLKSLAKYGSDKNSSELSASVKDSKYSEKRKTISSAESDEIGMKAKNDSADTVLKKFGGELGNGADAKPKNNKMMEAALAALEAEEKRQKLGDGKLEMALGYALNPTVERSAEKPVVENQGAGQAQAARVPAGIVPAVSTTIFQIVRSRIRLCESRGDINGKSALEKIP